MTNKLRGEGRDVDAYPSPAELMGGVDPRAAATERIEDHVTLAGGCRDNTF